MNKQNQNLIAGMGVAAIVAFAGIAAGLSGANQNQQTNLDHSKDTTTTVQQTEQKPSNNAPKSEPETKTEETKPTEPKIETKIETSSHTIPYETKYVDDNNLAKGTTKVKTAGKNGTETTTYEVTYTDDVETDRKTIKTEVTQAPVTEVIARGTYVKPQTTSKPQQTPSSNCNIKGNISTKTGEKIYHVPGQQFYNKTEIDPSKGERWFCSESEARAAGWRKSKR